MGTDFKQSYQQAIKALADKLIQQVELEREIAQLKQYLVSLEKMMGLTVDPQNSVAPAGLKNACLQVLMTTQRPLTASEVAQYLVFTGLNTSEYAHTLAPVTTTLKRLVESGQIEATERDGRPAYLWDYEAMVKRFKAMEETAKKYLKGK